MVGTGTIVSDIQKFIAKILGKEDPTLKIGVVNKLNTTDGDYVWALRDINFAVEQGEVLGIIGKNGAGKSTLLKILSKVTTPTTGSIKVKGRIASLLEVGTGFHPELSGRENIFLNGAILGMTKVEIRQKFDEIVDFAGVERYIDTPVKRYSSGMYVRLAFAVAAHLEPEILIVDEVLAVGDAEFQKKALGKMRDISTGEGRTVLFVSHNTGAISSLCSKCIYLNDGIIKDIGECERIVSEYLKSTSEMMNYKMIWTETNNQPGDSFASLLSVRFINSKEMDIDVIAVNQEFGIEIVYEIKQNEARPGANFLLSTDQGVKVFQSLDTKQKDFSLGVHKSICWFPANLLNDQKYNLTIALTSHNPVAIHTQYEMQFEVIDDINSLCRGDYKGRMHGVVRPLLNWETNKI
jgi:lipopolysaccharide transport system ATP-binding protein